MERVVAVKFDTEYVREKRAVRSSWGGWTPGTEVEVQMTSETGYPRWVKARIERWVGRVLMVSRLT